MVEHARHQPEVKLVRLSRNFGKDAALAAGLRYVSGAAVIPIDVDLQDSPEVLSKMVAAWMRGADVVNAGRRRRRRACWPKRRRPGTLHPVDNSPAAQPLPGHLGDFPPPVRHSLPRVNGVHD